MSKLGKKKQRNQKIRKMVVMIICGVMIAGNVAFASENITSGISNLSNLFVLIFRGLGGFLSIKSIGEGVTAWQQSDNSTLFSAIKGLAGGLCLFFVKEILGLIGVTI